MFYGEYELSGEYVPGIAAIFCAGIPTFPARRPLEIFLYDAFELPNLMFLSVGTMNGFNYLDLSDYSEDDPSKISNPP